MDQEVEEDNGDVTLVRVKEEDGKLVECPERTNRWAWKVPKEDGTFDMIEMTGHVEFHNVDFGYVPEKTVLHDITLYAEPGQKVPL